MRGRLSTGGAFSRRRHHSTPVAPLLPYPHHHHLALLACVQADVLMTAKDFVALGAHAAGASCAATPACAVTRACVPALFCYGQLLTLVRLSTTSPRADVIVPQIKNVVKALAQHPGLPADFPPKLKMEEWCVARAGRRWRWVLGAWGLAVKRARRGTGAVPAISPLGSRRRVSALRPLRHTPPRARRRTRTLAAMRAIDTIDEGQARQLVMDLDFAHAEFKTFLQREAGGGGV